jgi:uncharacterized protein
MANCPLNKQASLCRCLTEGYRINQKRQMHHFKQAALLLALATFSALPAHATPQLEAACDSLAASPEDMQRPKNIVGVKNAEIQMTQALPACQAALAAAPNNPRIQFETARLLNISKTDPQKMLSLYVASAKQNYAISMVNLGVATENGTSVKQNYQTAAKWYAKAAAEPLVNRVAQYNLALLHKAGLGVARDTTKYGSLACKSAKASYPLAFNDCGFAYDQGWGFDKNAETANSWYQKGATAGDAAAMANLGSSYETGSGVAKDMQRALELYKKSAALGNSQGMFNLASAMLAGRGIEKDVKAALELLQKSADAGNPEALTTIGMAYDNGQVVAQDATKASAYLLKALHLHSLDAQNLLLVKAGEGLSPETLAALQAQLQNEGKTIAPSGGKFSVADLQILKAY